MALQELMVNNIAQAAALMSSGCKRGGTMCNVEPAQGGMS